MENESDAVKLGKLLHKNAYKREEKDIRIGPIAIDFVRNGDTVEIREVKKSDAFEKAHRYQTLYYLYYLSKFGIKAVGKLSFPKQKKTEIVELDEDKIVELDRVIGEIERVVRGEMPKPEYRKVCRKCAYFEFCFS